VALLAAGSQAGDVLAASFLEELRLQVRVTDKVAAAAD